MAALHLIADVNQHITNLHFCEKANMHTCGSHSLSLTTFSWWSLDSGINYHLCKGWSTYTCLQLPRSRDRICCVECFQGSSVQIAELQEQVGGSVDHFLQQLYKGKSVKECVDTMLKSRVPFTSVLLTGISVHWPLSKLICSASRKKNSPYFLQSIHYALTT